jgi:hypothetical protein
VLRSHALLSAPAVLSETACPLRIRGVPELSASAWRRLFLGQLLEVRSCPSVDTLSSCRRHSPVGLGSFKALTLRKQSPTGRSSHIHYQFASKG